VSDEKVTIVNVNSSGHKEKKTKSSWYNKVSAEQLDRWRIIPRLLMLLYGIAFFGSCLNHGFKFHGTDSLAIFIQAFYNSRTHRKLLIKESFLFSRSLSGIDVSSIPELIATKQKTIDKLVKR